MNISLPVFADYKDTYKKVSEGFSRKVPFRIILTLLSFMCLEEKLKFSEHDLEFVVLLIGKSQRQYVLCAYCKLKFLHISVHWGFR